MYLVDGTVVTSASDLKKASECEFAFLRELDAKLGRDTLFEPVADAMLERSGRMGDEHEHRVLEAYRAELGSAVVEIERPDVRNAAAVQAAVEATQAAFAAGAPVVFQATFADEGFIGFADFIVRQPDGRYLVQDSKLARRARVTALLQLAAYAEQLQRVGVPCADTVELLLGDGSTSVHRLDDIAPVYRLRRARLEQIVAERLADDGPVAWGDPRYELDGRCPTCDLEVQAHRDVLLVAGLRVTQRAALFEAGIDTIDALAASDGPVAGILDATIENLRIQARLQLEAEAAAAVADASGLRSPDDPPLPPPVVVRDAASLAAIPEPDAGDLFFDFEGDPLYTEGAAPTGASTTCSAWSTRPSGSRRSGRTASPRSAWRSSSSSPSSPRDGRRTRTCTSTTTRATSARTCSRSPRGTAWARRRSTSCSPTACSSTSTRS